jgi:hypothetical protein
MSHTPQRQQAFFRMNYRVNAGVRLLLLSTFAYLLRCGLLLP